MSSQTVFPQHQTKIRMYNIYLVEFSFFFPPLRDVPLDISTNSLERGLPSSRVLYTQMGSFWLSGLWFPSIDAKDLDSWRDQTKILSLSLCLSIKKFSKTSPLFTFLYIAHPKHSNIRYTHKQEQKKIEGWDCQFVGNRWLKKRIEDNATRGKCNWTSWNTFCVCSENVMVFTVCWTAAWHVTDGRKSGKNGTRSRFAHLSVKGDQKNEKILPGERCWRLFPSLCPLPIFSACI